MALLDKLRIGSGVKRPVARKPWQRPARPKLRLVHDAVPKLPAIKAPLPEIAQPQPIEQFSREERVDALKDYMFNHFLTTYNALVVEEKADYDGFLGSVNSDYFYVSPLSDDLVAARAAGDMLRARGHALYKDQLRYAIRIARALRRKRHVAFCAETQWGKTTALVMGVNLFRIDLAVRGITDTAVIMVNPSRNAPAEQSDDDFRHSEAIHSALSLGGNDRHTLESVNFRSRSTIGLDCMKRARKDQIHDIINSCLRNHITNLVLVIDEADEASGKNGVMGTWVTDLAKAGITVKLLLCSATAYQYQDISAFHLIEVNVPPDTNYAGLVKGKPIPIVSFDRVADLTKDASLKGFFDGPRGRGKAIQAAHHRKNLLPDLLRSVCRGIDDPKGKFNGKPLNGGRHICLRFGRSEDEANILIAHLREVGVLDELGLTVVPFYGTALTQGGRTVEKKIAEATGSDPNARCLILVLGAGRRADRFPVDCTIFIDCTESFADMAAAEQGSIGRATGWFKMTEDRSVIVILSPENERLIRDFRMTYQREGRKIPLKPITRAVRITKDKRARSTQKTVQFSVEDFHDAEDAAFIQKIFDRLRDATVADLSNYGKEHQIKGKTVYGKLEHSTNFVPVYEIIGEDDLGRLESILSVHYGDEVRLIRPGEERWDGKFIPVEPGTNNVKFSARGYTEKNGKIKTAGNTTARYYSHATVKDENGNTVRYVRKLTTKEGTNKKGDLSLIVAPVYSAPINPNLPTKNKLIVEEVKIIQLMLPLFKSIKVGRLAASIDKDGRVALPTKNCAYSSFLTKDEWLLLTMAQAAKKTKRWGTI